VREFVSLESLARIWHVDEALLRHAAEAAGVSLFQLHGRAHADKGDTLRLGDALFLSDAAGERG